MLNKYCTNSEVHNVLGVAIMNTELFAIHIRSGQKQLLDRGHRHVWLTALFGSVEFAGDGFVQMVRQGRPHPWLGQLWCDLAEFGTSDIVVWAADAIG